MFSLSDTYVYVTLSGDCMWMCVFWCMYVCTYVYSLYCIFLSIQTHPTLPVRICVTVDILPLGSEGFSAGWTLSCFDRVPAVIEYNFYTDELRAVCFMENKASDK